MASFLLFSTMGLFPNPGQNVYLISPPYFESVSITNALTNKTATIKNVNYPTGNGTSESNKWIQSVKLNGEPWTKSWIGHEFFTEGGILELTLGSSESDWGTKQEDRPPSMSVGQVENLKW